MALKLNFVLPEKLYLKDPQSSKYGKSCSSILTVGIGSG